MAQMVRIGTFIYRINPNDNREMQRFCNVSPAQRLK